MKMSDIKTHKKTSERFVGKPQIVEKGKSVVELKTDEEMIVDDKNLIHGGFIFGLADYAAMLAVNKETVVLGSSESKFLKPVQLGETLKATAEVKNNENHKYIVECIVKNKEKDQKVFEGIFSCQKLKKHVLD